MGEGGGHHREIVFDDTVQGLPCSVFLFFWQFLVNSFQDFKNLTGDVLLNFLKNWNTRISNSEI
jgi:hypothetical protein